MFCQSVFGIRKMKPTLILNNMLKIATPNRQNTVKNIPLLVKHLEKNTEGENVCLSGVISLRDLKKTTSI